MEPLRSFTAIRLIILYRTIMNHTSVNHTTTDHIARMSIKVEWTTLDLHTSSISAVLQGTNMSTAGHRTSAVLRVCLLQVCLKHVCLMQVCLLQMYPMHPPTLVMRLMIIASTEPVNVTAETEGSRMADLRFWVYS